MQARSDRLDITVPGEPFVQPRGKPVRRGNHVAMVSAYAEHPVWAWRSRIIHEARKAYAQSGLIGPTPDSMFAGPLILSVLFVTPFTGTARKKGENPRRWHDAKKDLDNFVKPVKDALVEAGVMADDGQIVMYGQVLKIRAAHGEQPHTRIRIEAAPDVETVREVWA